MPRYLLSLYQPDRDPAIDGDVETVARDLDALEREARAAGAWVFAAGLVPTDDTAVVRENLVTDGPYVEGKEHVGGFVVVDAPDREAALEWSRKLSRAATLPVEVRTLAWDSAT